MERKLTFCDIIQHYYMHFGEFSADGFITMWTEMKEIRRYYMDYLSNNHSFYTIEEIIRMCVRGLYTTGHQRRVSEITISEAVERLCNNSYTIRLDETQKIIVGRKKKVFEKFKDFEELYEAVKQLVGGVSGIGYVTIYDTARRIGYILTKPVMPCAYVYLHYNKVNKAAGSILGRTLNYREPTSLFLPYFCASPSIVEDLLCVYSDIFVKILKYDEDEGTVIISKNINWRDTTLKEFLNKMDNVLKKRYILQRWKEFQR